jgi:hypothetical protein
LLATGSVPATTLAYLPGAQDGWIDLPAVDRRALPQSGTRLPLICVNVTPLIGGLTFSNSDWDLALCGSRDHQMTRCWYVTFEVPREGTLVKRRNPRLTRTFETEADAKNFARIKCEEGLAVTAGTIIPHLPRKAIASVDIHAWLDDAQDDGTDDDGNPAQANQPD